MELLEPRLMRGEIRLRLRQPVRSHLVEHQILHSTSLDLPYRVNPRSMNFTILCRASKPCQGSCVGNPCMPRDSERCPSRGYTIISTCTPSWRSARYIS